MGIDGVGGDVFIREAAAKEVKLVVKEEEEDASGEDEDAGETPEVQESAAQAALSQHNPDYLRGKVSALELPMAEVLV